MKTMCRTKCAVAVTWLAVICIGLTAPPANAAEYTFGQWALDTGLPSDAWSAYAVGQGITSLDGIQGYPALMQINLSSNLITSIEPGQLTGRPAGMVLDLNLSHNLIAGISPASIEGIVFDTLNLDSNQIVSVEGVHFTAMTDVILSNNQITSIEGSDFSGVMMALDLTHNRITDLGGAVFSGMDVFLGHNQITNIDVGAFHGDPWNLDLSYNLLTSIDVGDFRDFGGGWLYLVYNQITTIASGAFSSENIDYLDGLYLAGNQIETLDLSGFAFPLYGGLGVDDNPLEHVIFADIVFDYASIMTLIGGVARVPGVKSIDFSGADFSAIYNLDSLFTAELSDSLWKLVFTNAQGLDDTLILDVIDSTNLASLTYLDVRGVWETFSLTAQTDLLAWDAIPGNTLVVPEPATMSLLAIGGLALLKRRRN